MSYNDLMSDYVARINNANMVSNEIVVVRKNNLVISVSKKLVTLGYLKDFSVDTENNNLSLTLNKDKIQKYNSKNVVVSGVEIPVSKNYFS